jgi:hypothetical protein
MVRFKQKAAWKGGFFAGYAAQPQCGRLVDPNCLALLKHYHSLAPMAMEAKKPMFHLKPADGAIGAHTYAVKRVYSDFEALTERLVDKMR